MPSPQDAMKRISPADIESAAERLQGVSIRTPLMENARLNDRVGGRVLIKAECLQRTGSFKIRGAYNRLSRLTEAEKALGVVAFSSGNHAQGVAEAARRLGIKARIVMPKDAPPMKRENTLSLGAEVILYDRYQENRESIARDLCAESGAILVPSYDDPFIIAGQGTVGLEIVQQMTARDIRPDAALLPVGGGGLMAGSATALKHDFGSLAIFGVEPEGFDDTARSLRLGERVTNAADARSICDALLSPSPGLMTFDHNMRLLDGGLAVSDAEVIEAMKFAFEQLKLVVEPGGAVALAALLSGRFDARGRTVAIVLSGGNIGIQSFYGHIKQNIEL
ncbi:serine/threonine dehydratase [Iodidimonas muriae]|uniref:Serine/threonine dehydratase n=1 Tax=Iodidimonas muriae TaxID=261467 RepID=A0ABQ2LHR9_9PROT|nr:threonine/serine dehydratase [Iodidimonas muriae]GER08288.1 serine/threonine dehydratase [Kordiimonadales bacterium JCM 17843]GGO16411.1 serine/threonine dehydratase [Iodidimonas muriae]